MLIQLHEKYFHNNASNLLLPVIIGSLIFFPKFGEFFIWWRTIPMNLGKSPARFDERPDTGISFDIAGIDEAKAEFEEIVSF
jgi:ATP-dependent Zn protease